MTQDQLDGFYKHAINSAFQYLHKKYSITRCNPNNASIKKLTLNDYNDAEYWNINVKGKKEKFSLFIIVPQAFPDIFPKIQLSKEDYERIPNAPHIDENRCVCTRNPDTNILEENKPGEALEQIISIATNILEDGINKKNIEDYEDEYLAYWNLSITYKVINLYPKSGVSRYLEIYKLSKSVFSSSYVLSSKNEIKEWCKSLNVNCEYVGQALHLKLKKLPTSKLNTNKDIYEFIKSLSNEEQDGIKYYLLNTNKNIMIIISVDKLSEIIMVGWRHRPWKKEIFKGYRKASFTYDMLCSRTMNIPIDKINIVRMDKERILERGGAVKDYMNLDITPAIVGCGSLGSSLSLLLAKSGISKFILIDNDILMPENTPRHLCGYTDAVEPISKVDAVSKKLKAHFPYITTENYPENILKLIKDDVINLNNYDIIIVAIGNYAVERRINYLYKKGLINKPIIYLWMEPYGVAGQMTYIGVNSKGACYNCLFNEKAEFLYSLANGNSEYSKKEAGCQSTFIPYSAAEISQFIGYCCRHILYNYKNSGRATELSTWIGNKEDFKKRGFKINKKYKKFNSYSIYGRKIGINRKCKLCNA